MISFIPAIVLFGAFVVIGVYWAILSRHFLGWTYKYNQYLHKTIDSRLDHPLLAPRAKANYARLEANGGLVILTWSIRIIGVLLAAFSLVTIIRIVQSFH